MNGEKIKMNNRRFTIFAFVAGVVLAGLFTVGPPTATAQTVDPHISICAVCPAGSDPNVITDTSGFQIGWDGNHNSTGPVLIIVGTYNNAAAPTLSFGPSDSLTTGPTGAAIYGWNGSQGVVFNSSSTNVYTSLGITPQDGGSSESFGNWNLGLTNNGIAAASTFKLYVYELTQSQLQLGPQPNFQTLDLSGATNGSYVVAYACEVAVTTASPNCPTGNEGAVPFTTAGLVDSAPEASAVTLTSLVLLAFGAVVVRARRHQLT